MGTVHQNGWTCQKLWKTSVPELFKCSGCQINVWWSCDGGWKLWRNIFVAGAIPVIILGHVNAFGMGEEHERPEFIPYEHLRIRTKKFPWGDGNHSFIHNAHVNALPDGYEEH